jgi:hypothetical protein
MPKPESTARGKALPFTSQSDSESKREDEEARKAAFESFGQQFLAQFGPLPPPKKRKRANEDHLKARRARKKRKHSPDDNEAEEWGGILPNANVEASIDPGSEDRAGSGSARGLYLAYRFLMHAGRLL